MDYSPTNGVHEDTQTNFVSEFSRAHPLLLPVILLTVAMVLRLVDIFVFKLDELLGEIILSKTLGLLLLLGYLWVVNKTVHSIGLHTKNIAKAVFIGGVGTTGLFVLGFGIQYCLLLVTEKSPELVFTAIDPKTGATGGVVFISLLVVGNLVNSFMEEGLFRGLMIPYFMSRLTFWKANTLQATLFGLWHIVWPLKSVLTGQSSVTAGIAEGVVLLLATVGGGLAFGYLFYRTGNLWTPWLAHTINNTVLNLVHIRSVTGLDAEMGIVMATSFFGYFVLMALVWVLTRRSDLEYVGPWSVSGTQRW